MLKQITGVKIHPSKAIVGSNAFAHESGIHQHGMLANSLTYEIMTPESVGVKKTSLVLGKHSGQHAFEQRLGELGYSFTKEEFSRLFNEFKNLADRKKNVEERDLIALVESAHQGSPTIWELDSFVVNSGNLITSTACVTLKKGDENIRRSLGGPGRSTRPSGRWRRSSTIRSAWRTIRCRRSPSIGTPSARCSSSFGTSGGPTAVGACRRM